MTTSIGYQLGIGSGLDIKSLVEGLANAQRAPKEALIEQREAANEARISGLAEVSAAMDNFSTALSTLIAGGTLSTQPTASEPDLVKVSALAGARLGGLTAELEVVQLAKAQTLESTRLAARTDPVGQGILTLTTAAGNVDIVIDASNDSLDGLAQAINAANRGVAASIITDSAGARLVLKGGTGAAASFTLSVPDGTASGLERFAYGPAVTGGMTQAQAAQDAVVRLDGVQVNRSSNSFSDLVAGVQIDLKKAAPGTLVALGATRPTAQIEQGVGDFVFAFNEVMGLLNEAAKPGIGGEGGALQGDLAVREMKRQLASLTSTALTVAGEGPHTLAEIGVLTNRDGTLIVDAFRLKAALASHPDAVEALFNPTQSASSGAVTIKNVMGKVKPGTYTLTDLVPASGGTAASGKVDGVAMTGVNTSLVAPSGSAALGLIVSVNSAAASVTITVEAGLAGALKQIRDTLKRAEVGVFAGASLRYAAQKKQIATDRAALEQRSEQYYNQLLKTFTGMERQVSAFKATQSYLEQQVKIWTNDRS